MLGPATIVLVPIVPSAIRVSGAPIESRSATWTVLPAGGSANELCVGQQLMSSLVPMPLRLSWNPSDWPTGVSTKGGLTFLAPSPIGRKV